MLRNYKTTISGCLVAIMNLLANGYDFRQILLSIAMAMVGLLAQDYGNVSKK